MRTTNAASRPDRDGLLRRCYAALLSGFILWQVISLLDIPNMSYLALWFDSAWCAMAALVLYIVRPQRETGMKLLLLGLGWTVLVCALRGLGNLGLAQPILLKGVFAFLLCYPLGMALSAHGIRRFLKVLCALWVGCFVALSLVAIWAAVNGAEIMNFSGTSSIGVTDEHRLKLWTYFTNSAALLGLAAMMCLMGAALSRRWPGRVVYLLALLPILMALSLTDGRTSIVTTGAGLGLTAAVLLTRQLRHGGRMKTALRAVCGAAVCVAVMAAVVFALPAVNSAIGSVSQSGGQVIRLGAEGGTALAEASDVADAPADTDVSAARGYAGGDPLTGRPDVWRAALKMIADKPWLLITGTSPTMTMGYVTPYIESSYSVFVHLHNVYLQTLVETGVVGFGILMAFLLLFAVRAWQLLFRGHVPVWQRLLPVLPLTILLGELVDSLTRLAADGSVSLAFLMLFCGLTTRFSPLPRDQKEKAQAE